MTGSGLFIRFADRHTASGEGQPSAWSRGWQLPPPAVFHHVRSHGPRSYRRAQGGANDRERQRATARQPAKTEEQHTPSPPARHRDDAEGELHVAEADHAGLVAITSHNTTPNTPAPHKTAVNDLRPDYAAVGRDAAQRGSQSAQPNWRWPAQRVRQGRTTPHHPPLPPAGTHTGTLLAAARRRAAGPRQRTGCAATGRRPREGSPMVAQHDPIVHYAAVSADAAQRGSRGAQSECTATAQPRCATSWVRMIVGAQRRGCAVAVTAHSPAPVRVGFPNAYRQPRPIPRHPASRAPRRRAAPAAIR